MYAINYDTVDKNSEVTFGYYDRTKYSGELQWYPNNSTKFFAIALDDVLFGNFSMKDKFCKNKTTGNHNYFNNKKAP
jgi:hypothetical protein